MNQSDALKVANIVFLTVVSVLALYIATAAYVTLDLYASLETHTKHSNLKSAEQSKAAGFNDAVEAENLEFRNLEAYQQHRKLLEAKSWFPWIVSLPHAVALIFAALSYGAIGGVIRTLANRFLTDESIEMNSLGFVALSALMGFIGLTISYAIPVVFSASDSTTRPTSLVLMCLLAGLFPDLFYARITAIAKELFGKIRINRGRVS